MLGVSPRGRLVGAGDMKVQTVRALEQLATSLELLGLTVEDVVKITVYITDWREYVAYNEVYGDFFQSPYPARSTVRMGLPLAGALIQVDAIAVAGASESAIALDSDRTFWKGGRG
jgi:2-iminobutanoate/2-iminopropanoate deaminase